MKTGSKFFAVVLSLILASVMLLVGCMSAIGSNKEDPKHYEMDSDISGDEYSVDFEDYVFPPSELDLKFSEMSVVNEETNTIMLITPSYFSHYWKDNCEEEVIHSLTAEEVKYIISDSIRIYNKYDRIIVPDLDIKTFSSKAAKDPEVQARIPTMDSIYSTIVGVQGRYGNYLTYDWYKSDIYEIICWRITALSSPKAFIYDEEVSTVIDTDIAAYPTDGTVRDNVLYPANAVYIPGYSAETDRDRLVSVLEGSIDPSEGDEWFVLSDLVSQIYFRTTDKESEIILDCLVTSDVRSKNNLYSVYPMETLPEYEYWVNKYKQDAEILQTKLTEKQMEFIEAEDTLTKEEKLKYSVEIETLRNSLNYTKRMMENWQESLDCRTRKSPTFEEWLAQQDK